MKRAIFDFILFLSIFTLPWWITAVLAFSGIFIFKQFYEFILASMIVYALFVYQSERLIASPIFYPLIVCILFIGIEYLKSNMILYKNDI